MTRITTQLLAVRQRIAAAEVRFERVPGSVQLLAVSKGQPPPALREACAAGQRCFGESYVQEALGKITALSDCAPEWHFIGPLQRNKTRAVAATLCLGAKPRPPGIWPSA